MWLDITIFIMLVVNVVYAVLLNRKLHLLKHHRGEMEAVTRNFVEASTKADTAIQELKRAANGMGKDLQKNVDTAKELRHDLALLVETGELLARRLEKAVDHYLPPADTQPVEKTTNVPPEHLGNAGTEKHKRSGRMSSQTSDQDAGAKGKKRSTQDLLKAIENMR